MLPNDGLCIHAAGDIRSGAPCPGLPGSFASRSDHSHSHTLVVVDGLARVRERKKECGNHVGLMVSLARPYLAARRNPVPYFFSDSRLRPDLCHVASFCPLFVLRGTSS